MWFNYLVLFLVLFSVISFVSNNYNTEFVWVVVTSFFVFTIIYYFYCKLVNTNLSSFLDFTNSKGGL
jgi:hypothetical protein